jgi:hypothetical protein
MPTMSTFSASSLYILSLHWARVKKVRLIMWRVCDAVFYAKSLNLKHMHARFVMYTHRVKDEIFQSAEREAAGQLKYVYIIYKKSSSLVVLLCCRINKQRPALSVIYPGCAPATTSHIKLYCRHPRAPPSPSRVHLT